MQYPYTRIFLLLGLIAILSCNKDGSSTNPPIAKPFTLKSIAVDAKLVAAGGTTIISGLKPVVQLLFSNSVGHGTVSGISWKDGSGVSVPFTITYGAGDSVLNLTPESSLSSFSSYTVGVDNSIQSAAKIALSNPASIQLRTAMDNTDKFQRISTDELLTRVQRQTFKYFWEGAHPVSGLSKERNTSGDVVTSGGSGMGIMALIVGVHRGFITRAEGMAHVQKMVSFLRTKADRFKGAFPHWLNGATGKVVPFSAKDNGADLVETALLMQGLLAARQFFDGADAPEVLLRNEINALWQGVDWDWFRRGGENKLYWHWSPDYEWDMNMPVSGWNEALIVYVLAAASPSFAIPKEVYDEGWARGGAIRNGATYYGQALPLGPAQGGPLFFSHYSFLGLNPFSLQDQYASYEQQVKAHSLINYSYCVANPKGFVGYGDSCWGLTASDDNKVGYLAHDPQNDNGVITPTAALSSMPYTPAQSIGALEFFYYKLGDRIWKEYGFVDAFNLTDGWFANSFLAIDQGPTIIMIENYRSGLIWNLFMSAPEVKTGLTKLGFR